MGKERRLLFLVASLGVGGAQKIAAFVMNACIRAGYKVSVISLSEDELNVELDKKIECTYVRYNHKNKYLRKIDEIMSVKNIIKNAKPDIVIVFGSYTFPSIGVVCAGVPAIGCERGDPYTYSKFRQMLNKLIYKKYIFSVFQSEGARDYYGLDYKKTAVICNPCFDVDVSALKKEKVISAAGRLSIDKGFDTLIDAFNIIKDDIPDYKVVIYGDGPYRDELRKKIDIMKLNDRVTLFGKVKKIPEYIGSSSLFVLSSWFEGLPNVLIEAMALGLPIVSTDCSPGGARFLMDNGNRGGIIVPINDSSKMAEAIKYIIFHKEEAAILAEKGKDLISLYSPTKIELQWIRLFNNILNK
ncbi:MAG: glycosyltransferase [Anaerostipes sp.]|nr:glycosyltransferase [Anaerostipes sp.]